MRQVFFGLCIFSLFLFSYPAILSAQEPLAAPSSPGPETGAPFVSLPLVLGWEDVPGALAYRYELIGYDAWLQEKTQQEKDAWIKEWTDKGIMDWMEDGAQNGFLVTQSQSNPFDSSILKFLEPTTQQQKQLWHVKSCGNVQGTQCGPYGSVWDFAYVPGPPPVDSFSPTFNETNVKLPVTLRWGEVAGAKSYLLRLPVLPAALSLLTPEEKESAGLQPSKDKEYLDDACLFTRGSEYGWGVASCLDADGVWCGPFQQASFSTALNQPPLAAPKLAAPLSDPAKPIPLISMSSELSWSGPACAYLYSVKIARESDGKKTEFFTNEVQVESVRLDGQGEKEINELKQFWKDPKNLNQVFSWQVTPCWANPFGVGADCASATPSESWKFRTSATAPTLQKPANGESTKIPILLSWQGDGTSYRYQVAKDAGFTQIAKEDVARGTSTEIPYAPPDIVPGAPYWWHVKTCVDENGDVCGPWSEPFKFSTFALLIPDTPNPLNGGIIQLDQSVSWKSVDAANAYAYHLEYACRNEKENKEECVAYGTKVCPDTSAMKTIEDNKITARNSFELPYCMGQYAWKALACLQDQCQDPPETRTTWSNNGVAWELSALQPPSAGAGLVPCGRLSNDDATPYDETEKCQLKHAGFLLQNLLDFILWKVSLFVLLVLAIITGATSYFSLGGPNALARIKTVFRSFFVGFLVLMFAWMLVNIVLMLFGFQFEFFGTWWELSF